MQRLKLLGHEATHSAQFAELGKAEVLARRLKETFKYGPSGQYEIPDGLGNANPAEINIVDPDYALEAEAARVEELVETAGGPR